MTKSAFETEFNSGPRGVTGRIVIEVETGDMVQRAPGGAYGSFSWQRFVQILRQAGEVKPNETVTHVVINLEHKQVLFNTVPREDGT